MIRSAGFAFILLFSSLASAMGQQKPLNPPAIPATPAGNLPTDTPPAHLPAVDNATAELVLTLRDPQTITIGSLTWSCSGRTCQTNGLSDAKADGRIEACRELQERVGAIRSFGTTNRRLTTAELERCNQGLPTEDTSLRFEPHSADYQEQRKEDREEPADLPTSYPLGRPADELRLVSIDPSTGTLMASEGGGVRTRENGIVIRLAYGVNSVERGRLDAVVQTSGAGWDLTSHRTYRDPAHPERFVTGNGEARIRIALTCDPGAPDLVRDMRLVYALYAPGNLTPLVQREEPIPHTLRCREITGPGPAAVPSIDSGVAKPQPAAIDPRVAERIRACPDPATVEIHPRLVGRTDPSRGVGIVRIVGIVRNVGRAAYISEPRQQSVELIEEQPGTAPRVVASQAFTNLPPNGTVRLAHRRGWDTSTEFQPRYRLRLAYEPDIRTDANPGNDDCGLENNEAILDPARINALFQ